MGDRLAPAGAGSAICRQLSRRPDRARCRRSAGRHGTIAMRDMPSDTGAARSRAIVQAMSRLRGRCRTCRAPIGGQHLAIELAALGVALSALTAGTEPVRLWIDCGLGWTLLTLAWIDWRHLRLPDTLHAAAAAGRPRRHMARGARGRDRSCHRCAGRLSGLSSASLDLQDPPWARWIGTGRCEAARSGRRVAGMDGAAHVIVIAGGLRHRRRAGRDGAARSARWRRDDSVRAMPRLLDLGHVGSMRRPAMGVLAGMK